MLISWEQVKTILLPAIEKARKEPSSSKKIPSSYGLDDGNDNNDESLNIYEQSEAKHVRETVAFRLDVPFHRCTTPPSVMNTLVSHVRPIYIYS